MLIYLLYVSMPVLAWFAFTLFFGKPISSSEKMKKRYITFCGIVLFLIIALRHYSVGSGDGEWYYMNWKYLSDVSFKQYLNIYGSIDIENGYLFSIWLISHVFKDPQFVFVFYGLLMAISVSTFVYKNCEDPVLAFVMFNCLGLWGFMVQGIRQGIAMCICLFAIEACKQKKLIRFIFIVILAMLFHASAVVFFAVYPLSKVKMDIKGYLITIVVAVIASMSMDTIFSVINTVIDDTYEIGDIDSSSGGLVSVAIYVIVLVATLVFYSKDSDEDNNIQMFFYITLWGFIMFLMRYFANSIAQRAAYYYMFGQLVLLPSIIKNKLGREGALAGMLAVGLCVGIAVYKASYSVLVPYYFFWQA